MMSLFSPFDLGLFFIPSSFMFFIGLLVFNKFWNINLFQELLLSFFTFSNNFFLSLKPKGFSKFSTILFLNTFLFLLFCNFFSVFSFNFPLSSQVSVVFMISLGVWTSLVSLSVVKNPKGFFSHLIPEGTPMMLTFVLFLIELVSASIRPLTLMVRLVANILAGHILMSLLSSLVFIFSFSFPIYMGLNMVELFVAMIQSYIFATMIVLYFSEV